MNKIGNVGRGRVETGARNVLEGKGVPVNLDKSLKYFVHVREGAVYSEIQVEKDC